MIKFWKKNLMASRSDQIRSDQLLSRVRLFATPWTAARQASLSFTIAKSLLKLTSIELVMPSNHLVLCRPLLLPPSIFPSIKWPKHWSFSFSISPSNEYSGLISLGLTGWSSCSPRNSQESFQHHNLKASILWHLAFYMVQLISIHDYWKNHKFDYLDLCQQNDASAF